VDLKLLEATGISEAVSVLRNHPDASLAALAERIAMRWRQSAAAALEHANRFLSRGSTWLSERQHWQGH
jgi:hypothetical protein